MTLSGIMGNDLAGETRSAGPALVGANKLPFLSRSSPVLTAEPAPFSLLDGNLLVAAVDIDASTLAIPLPSVEPDYCKDHTDDRTTVSEVQLD